MKYKGLYGDWKSFYSSSIQVKKSSSIRIEMCAGVNDKNAMYVTGFCVTLD